MTPTLKDIAKLRSGYPFRAGLSPDPDGDIAVVQGRDVEENALKFRPGLSLARISGEGLRRVADHFLRSGDVLLMARGPRNYATMVETGPPEARPVIAVGSFHVITPDPSKVLPHYLAWWLSQESAQAHFRLKNTGTIIPMIALDAVRSLPVSLPPFDIQQRIAALSDLFTKERDTSEKLTARRQLLLNFLAKQSA